MERMDTEKKIETVLVTGAAGTVGAYVVRELVNAGRRVIAVDRPGARWELPEGATRAGPGADGRPLVEIREGDLTDLAFALDAVAGAGAVIHTAATIDLAQPYEAQARINVDAVRYVYEAARARGARRFVHLSTASMYAKVSPAEETTPLAPSTDYERTKAEAERYLFSRPRGGTEVTVLRPSMIYGPRARFLGARVAIVPPMLALALRRIPRIRRMPRCNWVHAEDVARAAVFLLDEPRAAWEAYNVADDTPLEFGEVLEVIARAYGFEIGRDVYFPRRVMSVLGPVLAEREWLLGAGSVALERVWRIIVERHDLAPGIVPGLDREAFMYAAREAVFDNRKLKALGFALRWPGMAEGYPPVLRWFQERRWVPSYDPSQPASERGAGVGFQFEETMAGTWRRGLLSGAHPFRFDVVARAASARRFARDGRLSLEGTVDAVSLARRRPLRGTLDISWRGRRELCYAFDFEGDDGRRYRFLGKKDVRLLRLVRTMTTLPGRILDAGSGEVVGTVDASFDLRRDLLPLVASIRAFAGRPRAAAPAPPAPAPAPA
jgi:nucleoside-diphosphate-sugar epimerase